ncbi:hypothetical protein QWY75_04650 [Pontixanthobacter aestiaquae]|uniref:Uncharacterized protein n=1 Tax=Pontixanthobacter aestiaquae TaxID=1509367 RepID=A0A844Z7L3_9SPHN|nr:hypothetical protein [Pontixanthobacter aestiaquae]MDN3645498.1 hypothetical protein [Pontixanthobacter aestiaquae]MXO83504.1 hypothetical protein [Pontixanthobacter aestiaquae]
MNTVQKARRDILIALVIEAEKGSSSVPDVLDIGRDYHLKYEDNILKSAVTPWLDRGYLISQQMMDGSVIASIKPAKFSDALSDVLDFLDATFFRVDWKKEEVITDADQSIEIPCREGWKLFHTERPKPKQSSDQVGRDMNVSPAQPINISNTFSPNNTVEVGSEGKAPSNVTAWLSIVVALIVGAVSILVALWIGGKI